MQAANCATTDPEVFFPEGGSTRTAKAVCSKCDVTKECLEYAIINKERHGVYGGMSERERRVVAREMKRDAELG